MKGNPHCSHNVVTMESIDYKKLPRTPYPSGTYIVLHHGKVPAEGLVLSDVKIVPGWPNNVLEAARRSALGSPKWLEIVDYLAHSNDRPVFNMGVFEVDGNNYPAAVYGTLEAWRAPPSQQSIFRNHLSSVPENMQHLAHMF